jgi:hypothetical protein
MLQFIREKFSVNVMNDIFRIKMTSIKYLNF